MSCHLNSDELGRSVPRRGDRSLPALLAAAGVLIILAVRQLSFVQQYAVDVLYWDSWDLYDPLFRGQGWWASFDQQHGPHRQGLGGLLIRAMAERTKWDCRGDAAAVSVVLIMAATLGLLLAWRCGMRGWALVGVAVIYLNLRQYQMLVALANPSHGAIPILLLTVFCLAYFIPHTLLRLILLVATTFCCVFTGFAIFIGVLAPVLLGIELRDAVKSRDRRLTLQLAAVLLCVLATWALFAVGYDRGAASNPSPFPLAPCSDYAKFIGLMSANAVGATTQAIGAPPWAMFAIGTAIAAAGAAVCLRRAIKLFTGRLTNGRVSVVIFTLSAFGILFTLNAALGRTPTGWLVAASPRYVTLCIPTLTAILLELATARRRGVRRLAIAYGGSLALGTTVLHAPDVQSIRWAHDGCLRWRAAYMVTRDFDAATGVADFAIYPTPTINDRLHYLEAHHLNLFDPDVFGPAPSSIGNTVSPRIVRHVSG